MSKFFSQKRDYSYYVSMGGGILFLTDIRTHNNMVDYVHIPLFAIFILFIVLVNKYAKIFYFFITFYFFLKFSYLLTSFLFSIQYRTPYKMDGWDHFDLLRGNAEIYGY
ncbi:MAG: hypothetical protein KDK90_04045 [Leptospiraceae bacterium]|nr:hypothetical protein [Leptospiraceae bacterium]